MSSKDAPAGTTAAVFLNFRTAGHTISAIRSLQASAAPPADIIVVDNASGDGSPERLCRELPAIHLIRSPINGGFSAGCNLGIREALARGAGRVLLLNTDVTVPFDMVTRLEGALARDHRRDLGIVAPVVVSQGAPHQVQSMGIRYNPATGRMRHAGFGADLRKVRPFDLVDVDGVSGCAMMIRREVFDRIGLLAEEYFFGYEDLDFCLRARAAGFATACLGTATVHHEGSVSIGGQSPQRIYFGTRNHLLLGSRFPLVQSPLRRIVRTTCTIGLNLAYALAVADVPRRAGCRAWLRGIRDHFAGRYGAPAKS